MVFAVRIAFQRKWETIGVLANCSMPISLNRARYVGSEGVSMFWNTDRILHQALFYIQGFFNSANF